MGGGTGPTRGWRQTNWLVRQAMEVQPRPIGVVACLKGYSVTSPIRVGIISAAVLLCAASTTAAASGVGAHNSIWNWRTQAKAFSNGSFENPQLLASETFVDADLEFNNCASPSNPTGLPCRNSIGPWEVTQRTVDLVHDGWPAPDGSHQIVDLNGTNPDDLNKTQPGAISQRFATKTGAAYSVTFKLAANFQRGPTVKTGEVLINNQKVQTFAVDATGKSATNMGWEEQRVTFVAVGKATTLTLASTTGDAVHPTPSGPLVDDVKVQRLHLKK